MPTHTVIRLLASYISYSVADPDPGSGAFLIPGSGMGKKSESEMNNPDHIPRAWKPFFRVKYLNSCMRIGDPGWKKFGSGINIADPHHQFLIFHLGTFTGSHIGIWEFGTLICSQCILVMLVQLGVETKSWVS